MKSFSLKSKTSDELFPYTVERTKPFKKGIIVKAAEIANRNDSEAVEHMEFFVDDALLVSAPGENIYLSEILNFKLKNPDQTVLGEIVGFSSNGVQDLLVVQTSDKKVEVPFVDAFIKKIDFKHSAVVMDLPEGLFDLENI